MTLPMFGYVHDYHRDFFAFTDVPAAPRPYRLAGIPLAVGGRGQGRSDAWRAMGGLGMASVSIPTPSRRYANVL